MKNIIMLFIVMTFFFACKQNSLNYLIKKEGQTKTEQVEEIDNWLNQRIKTVMAKNDIPAISIGIIKDGKVEIAKGYGVMKRGESKQVDENTFYQIGSLSKTFTGIIANSLILEGKLNPNESITTYLQDALSSEAQSEFSKIKLSNLLNHTAGIPRSASSVSRQRVGNNNWTKGYSETELIKDINQLKLNYEPGTKWEYSNFAYAIVGFICEQASGKNYETLLRKYVTEKFDLPNTHMTLSNEERENLPTPYMKEDRFQETKAFVMGKLTPASALFSNITDLSNLMVQQMDVIRKLDADQNVSPLMLTTEVAETGMKDGLSYGIGFFKDVDEFGTSYGHGGDIDGFACDYRFTTDQNMGVIILTSSGGRWVRELFTYVYDQLRSYDSKPIEN